MILFCFISIVRKISLLKEVLIIGSIRKTKSGKYEAFIYIGKDPATGKRKRASKTFKLKKEAKDWIAKKSQEKRMGISINTDYIVKEYLLKWLQDYAEPNLSPTTYDGYQIIVKKHLIPALGAIQLDELQPIHIQSYQSHKLKTGRKDGKKGGLSKKTLLQHHRVLSKALKQAVLWQLLSYNPASAVKAPTPEKPKINAMTLEEVYKILEIAKGSWMYYVIYVAVNTGMRRGEILGLRWQDINFNNKFISVRQTIVKANNEIIFKEPKIKSSKRTIRIDNEDIDKLNEVKEKQKDYESIFGPDYNKHNLISCYEDGSPPFPDTVTKRFTSLAKKVNLDNYRFHDLRHTHASLMLESGTQMKVIQERLGHSNITTTMDTYAHLQPNIQKEAVSKFKKHIKRK